MFPYIFCLLVLFFGDQIGAEVILTGTAKVKELIEKLTLNCFTRNFPDMYSINRLNIQKGGEIFASVDSKGNVDFLRNDMDMKANGFIDQGARIAYLNLTIGKPLRKLTSKYMCSALTMSKSSFEQQFTSSELQVEVKAPSDVETNSYLVKKVHYLNQLFTDIDNIALVDKQELENFNSKMISVTRGLDERLTSLSKGYIETGTFRCENPREIDDIHYDNYSSSKTYVKFNSVYSKPPRVLIRIRMGEIENYLYFWSESRQITTNGFTAVCGTKRRTSARMLWAEFMWISFP